MVERWPVKASRMKGPLFKTTEHVLFEEQQTKIKGAARTGGGRGKEMGMMQ